MHNSQNVISRTFEAAPGISLHYEVTGNCAVQKRILLLHGFGASTEDWTDVRDQLGEEACVVSLDLKGHGRSSRPRDGDYSLDSQAEILLAFLSDCCSGDTILVGHSYGGAVALLAATKAQERGKSLPLSALVLVDVPAYPQPVPAFLSILYKPVIGSLVSLLPSRVAVGYSLRKAFYDHRKLTPPLIDRYASVMDMPGSHYALALAAKQIFPKDIDGYLAGLRKISIPTLIVWGDHDRIVKPEIATRLNKDISASSLKFIQNCGHVPQEECPELFLETVKSYLAALPESSNRVVR